MSEKQDQKNKLFLRALKKQQEALTTMQKDIEELRDEFKPLNGLKERIESMHELLMFLKQREMKRYREEPYKTIH